MKIKREGREIYEGWKVRESKKKKIAASLLGLQSICTEGYN